MIQSIFEGPENKKTSRFSNTAGSKYMKIYFGVGPSQHPVFQQETSHKCSFCELIGRFSSPNTAP